MKKQNSMSQSQNDLQEDIDRLPCTVFTYDEVRIERAYRILDSVWQTIPDLDRVKILSEISMWSNTQFIVFIDDDWRHSRGTNARIFLAGDSAAIEMESGYFDAADDNHVMTTFAHELGHLRGSLDDDLSEETATRYQHKWGFSDGRVVYNDEACRYMDSVLQKEDIPGQLFWGLDGENYFYLRGGAYLTLRSVEEYLMYDQPWATLKGLLLGYWPEELPEIAARETSADELEGTQRFAEYQRELTRITVACLPEEMW